MLGNDELDSNVVSFGNEELDKCLPVKAGDTIECKRCGQDHELVAMTDAKTGEPTTTLAYRCGGKPFLGAVNGKLVVHLFKKK
jgi:hypothetical protein